MKRIVLAIACAAIASTAVAIAHAPSPRAVQAGERPYSPPRTPWGDPDLQGKWPGIDLVGVPMQRDPKFGTRNVLTDEEFAQRAKDLKAEEESLVAEIDVFTAEINPNCAIRCPTSPQPHWQETGKPSRQASLIVDPPDGRQPALSAEGQKRQADQQAEQRARRDRLQGREADSYTDRSLYDRCVTRGPIGSLLPTIYNNGNEIVQGPGFVVIRHEMIHEARVVPLDGRPHAAPTITSYMGDARGWWEGNTLVVETTNFNGKNAFQGSSENLKVTERFTRTADDAISYRFTVEDPQTWDRPWTAEAPLAKTDGPIFEFACHETNYGIANILAGARADEKKAAEQKKGSN